VGWTHGIFVFVYLIALGSASRVEGWSWLRTALAFAASFFPFGTFVLEWRLKEGAGR
jgi:integral membrane protein